MQQSVLFMTLGKVPLLEMLRVAKHLEDTTQYSALFAVKHGKSELAETISKAGFSMINFNGDPVTHVPSEKAAYTKALHAKKQKSIKDYIHALSPKIIKDIGDLRNKYMRSKRIFAKHSIVALAIKDDRDIGWETALVRVANEHTIPSVIIPYAISDRESIARSRKLLGSSYVWRYTTKNPLNAVMAILFPKLKFAFEGETFVFYDFSRTIAAMIYAMMPQNPWALGGGNATKMYIESQKEYESYMVQGVQKEKMIVTGKPSMDQLFEASHEDVQQDVRRELGIKDGDTVLLCAVPHLAEHKQLSWEDHWKEIEYLVRTLANHQDSSTHVLLSLHPKSDPDNYKQVATKFGVKIAERRCMELLPIATVFIATYSSTVAQAMAFGIPSVVVDFYNLDFDFYDNIQGVSVVREKIVFESELQKLLQDQQYFASMQHSPDGSSWAFVDGNCTQRIVNELVSLIR